jgi:hypothetical protein
MTTNKTFGADTKPNFPASWQIAGEFSELRAPLADHARFTTAARTLSIYFNPNYTHCSSVRAQRVQRRAVPGIAAFIVLHCMLAEKKISLLFQ